MAKDFDRILKENIVEVLLPLSRKLLGFEVASTRDLDTKLQKTIEREPDFLRVIETGLGEEYERITQSLDIMPFSIDITQDGLYKKGKAGGREEIAVSMLSLGKYSLEEIAKVTGLTLKRIEELQERLV